MDPEIRVYLSNVQTALHDLLDDQLVGLYVYGSLAMNGFVAGKSDLDLLAVVLVSLTDFKRTHLTTRVAIIQLPAAVRGLDLCVVATLVAAQPAEGSGWEAMIQVSRADHGIEVRERERYDPRLPLDLALAREHGVALAGPSFEKLCPPIPAAMIQRASTENVRLWANRKAFVDPSSGVLNVCRAWRYHEEGILSSKMAAGEWARTRGFQSDLIDAALGSHHGARWPAVPAVTVTAFFQRILDVLERPGERGG